MAYVVIIALILVPSTYFFIVNYAPNCFPIHFLFPPLTLEVTAPIKAITAPVKKALPMPIKKASAETDPPLTIPTYISESTLGGIRVAATAPITAKLSDCPIDLIVPIVPEASPKNRLSTLPITELVLGAENRPIPTPSRKSSAAR